MSPFAWLLIIIFWLSAVIIGYAYVGYPLLVTILARVLAKPVRRSPITPPATLLIAAYNEEKWIEAKLENALTQDYPAGQLEIVVVADGSDDGTADIVSGFAGRGVRLLHQPERKGKAAALNRAVPLTQGEVIVFSDANTFYREDAIRKLMRNFADSEVGCVAGRKGIRGENDVAVAAGESLYWRYENHLKRCDSAIGSVMGAPGEIFAIRRELWSPLEQDLLIEDFVLSLRIVEEGWRAIYDPEAMTWEEGSSDLRGEWVRRTRIAAGGLQAFFRLPGMLHPRLGLSAFQYISHRMLRWILTPSLFLLLLLASLGLVGFAFYRFSLLLQLLFYALAVVGFVRAGRGRGLGIYKVPFYVALLNAAALVGGYRYLRGKQPVTWLKAR